MRGDVEVSDVRGCERVPERGDVAPDVAVLEGMAEEVDCAAMGVCRLEDCAEAFAAKVVDAGAETVAFSAVTFDRAGEVVDSSGDVGAFAMVDRFDVDIPPSPASPRAVESDDNKSLF